MTSTTDAPVTTDSPVVDVSVLDVRETLLGATAERLQADRSEARLLELAIHMVHLYPVDENTCTATWNPSESLDEAPEPVAGVGTPAVAEQAVEELGAALGITYHATLSLVSDSLELQYRLPRLWALVQDGRLQAWKARSVATHTRRLSRAAVDFVDRQAALFARGRNRVPADVRALIHQALSVHEPETAQGREEAALKHRDVRFDYDSSDSTSTAKLTATLETSDALELDATISDLASQMDRLGDQSPLGTRRAAALGLLAHPQRALDLFGKPETTEPHDDADGPERKQLGILGGTLYVHVTGEDLHRYADPDKHDQQGPCGAASIEKLGTVTLDLLKTWLQRFSGITIKPVLDMTRSESSTDTVDRHDPPAWMRDLVMLRDGHCVFPGCNIDARRCDLDHIEPYVDPDEGGPPGQTSPQNLACLCRRHHRLKTFTAWTYERAGPGIYHWTNPHGIRYSTNPSPKR
jgi:hypothetical protein